MYYNILCAKIGIKTGFPFIPPLRADDVVMKSGVIQMISSSIHRKQNLMSKGIFRHLKVDRTTELSRLDDLTKSIGRLFEVKYTTEKKLFILS